MIKIKKKILFIFHQRDFEGGASKSLISIIEKLKRDQIYEIIALVPKKGEISVYLQNLNIETYSLDYKWSMVSNNWKRFIKKIGYPILNKLFFYRIYKKLKNKEIDLIYTNTSVIEIGFYLTNKLGCKHIFHVREFGKEDHSLEYLYSTNYRIKLLESSTTKVVTISKALKKKYEVMLRKKIVLIYNGVEDNFIEKKYISNSKVNFILVGNINKGKNQLEALKAGKKLLERGITNFKISFVGPENTVYKKDLENYIKKNQLEKNIVFYGLKSSQDIKKMINESDVGLMLSLNEAFGRVTIEYMLGGLPVIASNTGANPELIEDEINGYLYEIGNIEELAYKMEKFIKDFNKIEKIGQKAREIAKKNYTAEINYKNIKKLIEEQLI